MWGRVRSALKMMPNYRARWFDTADINKLVPQEDRSTNWNALGTALGIPLPTLGDPPEFGSPSIPQTVSSMTGLLSWIMENHSDQFAWKSPATTCDPPLDADKWTNELIWDAVKSTISDALGVGADEVTPTARMVEDLGME